MLLGVMTITGPKGGAPVVVNHNLKKQNKKIPWKALRILQNLRCFKNNNIGHILLIKLYTEIEIASAMINSLHD